VVAAFMCYEDAMCIAAQQLVMAIVCHAVCCVLCCRWGGICCAPNPSVTEERFYLSEYSNAERAAGAHLAVLAFAHEAHRERDPHGGKGCGRDGCSSVLPRMQLPACCCCPGQGSGPSASRSSSGNPADAKADTAKPGQQAHAQGRAQNTTQPAVQMVPIDAACSTNGSSTGRGSGSSRDGRHCLGSLEPHTAAPAVQGVRR
jgi:hypothetical protein